MNGGDEVVAAPAGPPHPLEWKFSQVFGERTAGEEVQEGNCPTSYSCVRKEGMLFVSLSDPIPGLGLGFDSIRFGSRFVAPLFVLSSNACFGFWVSVLILVWLWVLFGFSVVCAAATSVVEDWLL